MDDYPELRLTANEEETEWLLDANCQGQDPDLWFPASSRSQSTKQALALCDDCPVKLECLSKALEEEINQSKMTVHGIRGGLGPDSRIKLRKQIYGR